MAFLLLVLGIYGVLFELYSPGWGVAGTLGAICLALSFFSLAFLPVQIAGLLLVVLGLAMFAAEAFVISFGALSLRNKAANWVGSGRGRKSTRPGANGVFNLSPFEFLDRLADRVPPPLATARGPPTDWGELVQAHDDRHVFQASPVDLPAIDIHSL